MPPQAGKQQKPNDSSQQADPVTGLLLCGIVASRRRRSMTRDGRTRFILTLCISDGHNSFLADRWSDGPMPDGMPEVGASVMLPVNVRTFANARGMAQSRLEWGPVNLGEEF